MAKRKNTEQCISLGRYRQLCDFDIPFNGAIDVDNGLLFHTDSDVVVNQGILGNVAYYNKTVRFSINKITYIIKKGDTLSALSRKFNTSIAEIMTSNNMKNADKIYVGKTLDFDVDIKSGYSVSCEMTLDLEATEQSRSGFSDTDLYKITNNIYSTVDSFVTAMEKNSGKMRYGNNFKIYSETPSSSVFYGNQHVKTSSVKGLGSKISKYTTIKNVPIIAVGFELIEVADGIIKDDLKFGHNAQKQLVGGIGSIAGGVAGAKIGAAAGAFFGGVGTVPGFVIGFVIGAIISYYVSENLERISEDSYEKIMKNKFEPMDRQSYNIR